MPTEPRRAVLAPWSGVWEGRSGPRARLAVARGTGPGLESCLEGTAYFHSANERPDAGAHQSPSWAQFIPDQIRPPELQIPLGRCGPGRCAAIGTPNATGTRFGPTSRTL